MTQEGSNSDSSSASCFESLYFKRSLHFSLGGSYQNAVLHIHKEPDVPESMVVGVFAQQGFLRRDLSRSVFAKQCAIRIDKQQKERYNNVVIDNDVII